MEDSILISTKKIIGLDAEYTAFDLDVVTHINAAFGVLTDFGVGPLDGFSIGDDGSEKWEDLELPQNWINLIRTYIYLKVRVVFDPPPTSFAIEAANKQIAELEFRISVNRENLVRASEGDAA